MTNTTAKSFYTLPLHPATLDKLQHRIAVLPGYSLPGAFPAASPAPAPGFEAGSPASRQSTESTQSTQSRQSPKPPESPESPTWPDVNRGTSLSGVLGGLVTVALVAAIGLGLRWRRRLN